MLKTAPLGIKVGTGLLGLGLCFCLGCEKAPGPAPSPGLELPASATATPAPTPTSDQALSKAYEFLEKARSSDGGWHSGKYRDMAEGPELTPFILKALSYSGASQEMCQPSVTYLQAQKPTDGLIYPVYTSAGMLLNRLDDKGLWKAHLLRFQADEKLGWSAKDREYGGWSYAMAPPRKPAKGPANTLSQSNLPSTLFALGGLGMSQGRAPAEVTKKALSFLQRCQNYPEGDGGFCASPTDEGMNKAGGHVSYGSATSDGLRGLLCCGLKPDHPRVAAARAWTEKNLSVDKHPGEFPEGRYYDRDSLYFYYCWSTAHALAALQRAGAELSEKEKAWQGSVRERLLSLQKPDGSWSNPASATREDDPLVATPFVMGVLVLTQKG